VKDSLRPKHCANMLHALAAPERLRIACYLRDGSHNVTEIAAMLGTTLVNASHHITVLRRAGVIRGRKAGRFVYYSLTPAFFHRDDPDRPVEYFDLGCCRLEVPRQAGSEGR
jgi:DNA-binding transcriptional ArsR family regulator